MRIPLAAPEVTESDIHAVAEVLRTSRLSLGPALEQFERSLAEYIGAPHAVAVSSGTSALHLCLQALGIGAGDEVILPSFAFIAVANAVRYRDAVPVFVDIDPHTLNLDPLRIEEAITPRTRVILIVHTFGRPAELSEVLRIAERHGLFVVEDACEAIGAEYYGQKCGAMGDAGVFGFYPNKQITTGEGGAIVTRHSDLARMVRGLRNQGRLDSDGYAEHGHLGYNYRISEMSCALGNAQLKRMEAVLLRREAVAGAYSERLRYSPQVSAPPLRLAHGRMSWFAYVVQLAPLLGGIGRERVIAGMAARGMECGRYFVPIHLQPIYRRQPWKTNGLPVTESIAGRTLALPFFNRIDESQICEVCDTLNILVDEWVRSSGACGGLWGRGGK